MMKRTLFFPLALLLSAGLFSTTACAEPVPAKAEKTNASELIKTDAKLGEGTLATAGKHVSVHYTGWLYDEAAADHHGKNSTARAIAGSRSSSLSARGR